MPTNLLNVLLTLPPSEDFSSIFLPTFILKKKSNTIEQYKLTQSTSIKTLAATLRAQRTTCYITGQYLAHAARLPLCNISYR